MKKLILMVLFSSSFATLARCEQLFTSGEAINAIPYYASVSTVSASELQRDSATSFTLIGSTFTVTGNAFSVGDSTFVVRSGNVGIGTAIPLEKLHIQGSIRVVTPSLKNGSAVVFVNNGDTEHAFSERDAIGIFGKSLGVSASSVRASRAGYGVYGIAVSASGALVPGPAYGVTGIAVGPGLNYGIYGYANGGSSNYAGYFDGDVVTTGTLTANAVTSTTDGFKFPDGTTQMSMAPIVLLSSGALLSGSTVSFSVSSLSTGTYKLIWSAMQTTSAGNPMLTYNQQGIGSGAYGNAAWVNTYNGGAACGDAGISGSGVYMFCGSGTGSTVNLAFFCEVRIIVAASSFNNITTFHKCSGNYNGTYSVSDGATKANGVGASGITSIQMTTSAGTLSNLDYWFSKELY
ncbi:MAG: hypothetical protein PHP45_05395 [Elusimicrobiales bacterium]|nr:hypothetical protein [Elusimicrobiales bacterium]